MWQKKKLLVLSNFFFCHYVFKKLSAAEASESVNMRERAVTTKSAADDFEYILAKIGKTFESKIIYEPSLEKTNIVDSA